MGVQVAELRQGGYVWTWIAVSMLLVAAGGWLVHAGYFQRETFAVSFGCGLWWLSGALFGFCACMKLARVEW